MNGSVSKLGRERGFSWIRFVRSIVVTALWLMLALALIGALGQPAAEDTGSVADVADQISAPSDHTPWHKIFTPGTIVLTLLLVVCSGFFSACEVAYSSLDPLRLRSMREGDYMLDRMAAGLMEHPGSLLTTILMANSMVNVLLGVVLASRVDRLFDETFGWDPVSAYVVAVSVCTAVLVFFGEITPKLLVVRHGHIYARQAAVPIYAVDRLLTPVRMGIIAFVGFIFRVTRYSEVRPLPFMTDQEFKSLLSQSEASGAIEKDEREMIQGILEFSDATVGEILVPRPDMIALNQDATVAEALAVVRKHEFARIPAYNEHLDQITGILFAKDLLPSVNQGSLDSPVQPLLHKAHFVPETMRVSDFIKSAQRLRTHMAIVVDEYGGTEGLVTLHDALREVVGEICEFGEEEPPQYTEIEEGVYEVEGGLAIYELEELLGVTIHDEEHNTVAGFLMDKSEKVPEENDELEHGGVHYKVESVDGKRVARVRIRVLPRAEEEVHG